MLAFWQTDIVHPTKRAELSGGLRLQGYDLPTLEIQHAVQESVVRVGAFHHGKCLGLHPRIVKDKIQPALQSVDQCGAAATALPSILIGRAELLLCPN